MAPLSFVSCSTHLHIGFWRATQPIAACTFKKRKELLELLHFVAGILRTILQHIPTHRDARVGGPCSQTVGVDAFCMPTQSHRASKLHL